MFKLAGSIFILCSATFFSCQSVLKKYCTYKYLIGIVDIIKKIQCELAVNDTYISIFRRINFDKDTWLSKSKDNIYINYEEIKKTEDFFDELGKHNSETEQQYIDYNLKKFSETAKIYSDEYNRIKKIHIVCGVCFGLFIIIVLI